MRNRKMMVVRLLSIIAFIAVMVISAVPVLADEGIVDRFGNPVLPPQPVVLVDGVVNAVNEVGAGSREVILEDNSLDVHRVTVENGTVDCSITIKGNGIWNFDSQIDITGQITVLSGTLNTNDRVVNCGSFYIGEYKVDNGVTVLLGNSTITCFAFAIRGDGVNFNAGTSTINTTLLFDDSLKKGHTYNKIKIVDHETVTVVPEVVEYIDTEVTDFFGTHTIQVRTVTSPAREERSTVRGYIEGDSSFKDLTVRSKDGAYLAGKVTVESSLVTDSQLVEHKISPAQIKEISITANKQIVNIGKISLIDR